MHFWFAHTLFVFVCVFTISGVVNAESPIEIGSRRELFVDRLLIDRMDGVELRMHHPVKVARAKSPLPVAHYITVIKDADRFRAYWRGSDPSLKAKDDTEKGGETVEYAESRDGREWTFPNLGLHDVRGTKDNNVILAKLPSLLHNFSPFLDTRPGVSPVERFKALAGHPGPGDKRGKAEPGMGLHAFVSADGIHWTHRGEVIPYQPQWRHAFDSQNVSFWSEAEQQYVCYFRTWIDPERLRSISRTTSKDFFSWTSPVAMNPNLPGEHLYTNQTHPYFRAPHFYLATPTRFVPGRGDAPVHNGKDPNATDIMLMSSRAGDTKYVRTFTDAFIRPGLDPGRWHNRSNYVALNFVPTGPAEISIYHRSGDRYVLRTDGFASVHAGSEIGELTTKPITFIGSELHLNLSTSAVGSVRVQIEDENGMALPGLGFADCIPIYGDAIDLTVHWSSDAELNSLKGLPVRLRLEMQECDLYSFRFE